MSETSNDRAGVIGAKGDTSFSDGSQTPTIIGHLVANYNHAHNSSRVYPRTSDSQAAAAITLTDKDDGGSTPWAYGAWVEITGFDSKTLLSDVHFVIASNISAADAFVVQLGTGASGSQVFWGECAFERDATFLAAAQNVPIQGPPIPAGTKLWARLASEDSDGTTCNIKVYSHEYPPVTGT
jgi:hypothetical protein